MFALHGDLPVQPLELCKSYAKTNYHTQKYYFLEMFYEK